MEGLFFFFFFYITRRYKKKKKKTELLAFLFLIFFFVYFLSKMSQKATSPVDSLQQQQQRPRSNSLIRALTNQYSPTQSSSTTTAQTTATQAKQSHFKRSMSVSEGLHVRLPTLYHSETEPISYSPVTQPTTPICPSDSNWANKYDDFDIGKPIGKN